MRMTGKRPFAATICVVFTLLISGFALGTEEKELTWYAGTWDSSIYNRAEKPRTVALRMEVVDADSGVPLPGVLVTLKGGYLEELLGPAGDGIGLLAEPVERDWELAALTGVDGVAVFALGWQKDYPWRFGRPAPRVDARGEIVDLP